MCVVVISYGWFYSVTISSVDYLKIYPFIQIPNTTEGCNNIPWVAQKIIHFSVYMFPVCSVCPLVSHI